MARMIDADRLLRELTALSHGQVWPGWTYDGIRLLIERQPTLTQPNEPLTTGFDVVDTKTGEYPDLEKIALKEDWAKHLMYCDMEGFAVEEDGTLLLLDECGRQACCPVGRFEIRRTPER
nr:MAG TPA: hypothetical protein [Caudoviricetes sp.]